MTGCIIKVLDGGYDQELTSFHKKVTVQNRNHINKNVFAESKIANLTEMHANNRSSGSSYHGCGDIFIQSYSAVKKYYSYSYFRGG